MCNSIKTIVKFFVQRKPLIIWRDVHGWERNAINYILRFTSAVTLM